MGRRMMVHGDGSMHEGEWKGDEFNERGVFSDKKGVVLFDEAVER
jgi:hypothetical protein